MKKIELSFSCDQKWDDMKNGIHGNKHCAICNKNIIDFESMSDDEVINYIQKFASSKPCGKITSRKLASINRKFEYDVMKEQNQKYSLPIFKHQYFIFPAFAAFIFHGNHISAQIHTPTSTEAIEPKDKDNIKSSTITKFKFEGQVNDEYKENVSFASIILMEDGNQIMSTESDIDGKFNFVFDWKKDTTYSILVKYLGYQEIQYTLSKNITKANFILKESNVELMGDLVIKNAIPPQNDIPEYKTWYNNLGNWFKKW